MDGLYIIWDLIYETLSDFTLTHIITTKPTRLYARDPIGRGMPPGSRYRLGYPAEKNNDGTMRKSVFSCCNRPHLW